MWLSIRSAPGSGWLTRFLLHAVLASAAVFPAPETRKRDDADVSSLINDLVNSFKSKIPTASPTGNNLLAQLLSAIQGAQYSVPPQPQNASRAANIALVKDNFLYGPPVAGGPSYPSGALGIAKDVLDLVNIQMDLNPEILLAVADLTKATLDFYKYNGLKTLDDYTRLYNGEWTGTVPGGPELGIETNYTQDLLFSMQRLSSSPYKIRRLNPNSDQLQFSVDDSIAVNITGQTLQSLLQQGRLFYADYRDQKNLTASGKYAAACDAYFYIDQGSGDFLPLAIRTNAGAPLIYTPLDSKNDWLLAKIMYNVDDFWFAQWNHLASTHEVVQIVWMAAIRTLSYRHPIFAVLNRLTYQVFSVQVLAEAVLFIPGGAVDLVFPYTGQSAQDFATNRYKYGGAGHFQSNYFTSDLTKRGLINSPVGPSLKHFPFYEDAGTIYTAILNFMKRLVYTFYASDAELIADSEIQAWVAECNGPAQVIDFPAKITDRPTLVYVLTHLAHLVSSAHHTVNTNELLKVSSTLPFCPPALYKAPPTTKNANTNLATFLPPLTKVLQQFSVGALFARPLLAGTNRTIMHMFDDRVMLARMPVAMSIANKLFMDSMQQFSSQVSSRGFDSTGLSQGMPFVWKALDPNVAPYYIAT